MTRQTPFRKAVIDYIMQRRCQQAGGYCFYRLEEPNGSDTFYALATLCLLDFPCRDEKTIRYLKGMQAADGSFESIFAAFYALKSLRLLNENTPYNPVQYVLRHIRIHHIENLPAEVASIFESLYLLSEICELLGIELDEDWRKKIVRFVRRYGNDDHGFGHPCSTLVETDQALTILDRLSCPVERTAIAHFIGKCEDPIYGFVNMPGTSPSFLEYVHSGVGASHRLSHDPLYRDQCIEFILACRNGTGGFSRTTNAGIATIENTYLAVHALALLSVLQEI